MAQPPAKGPQHPLGERPRPHRVALHAVSARNRPLAVYTQSVARWKRYERDLAELFAALPRAQR